MKVDFLNNKNLSDSVLMDRAREALCDYLAIKYYDFLVRFIPDLSYSYKNQRKVIFTREATSLSLFITTV